MSETAARPGWRPRLRLRTILFGINLVILALPLGGITWLRLYESALIRQTESELIAQGAFIEAAYLAALDRAASTPPARGQRARGLPTDYGHPLTAPPRATDPEGRWRPRWAELDLATDSIRPRPPPPVAATQPADPLALQVGRELTPVLRQAQKTTLAGMRIVDANGIVVASTGDLSEDDLGRSLLNHEEVVRALTGEPVSLLRWRVSDEPPPPLASISRGTRVRVFVTEPIERDGRVLGAVLLVRTPSNIKQAVFHKREPLLHAGLGLLALVALLTLLGALTITRPVRQLIEQARRAARGQRNAVIPLRHPVTREIAELSDTVAAMAQTLESRAQYIRDFATHVSHEFKTPLTAIQGAVELLRDHAESMSVEERARFLDNLGRDAQRLEHLVRRLLELARADMMQAGTECADLAAVLTATTAHHRERGLHIELATPLPAAHVAIGAETLDSILGTLLDNARQHGGETVRVRLSAQAHGDRMEIDVADDGSGISAANAERVFEPFFTTGRGQGRTGLGLSIVRALLAAHRGGIDLLPTARGTAFRITLPTG